MKLPYYAKPNPWFFKYIPILRSSRGNYFPFATYLRQDIYKDLKSKNPSAESLSVWIHEQSHRKSGKNLGWLMFGLKYWFSRRFRFEEELAGYIAMMPILKKNGVKFDFDGVAKALSGGFYQWATNYKTARKELDSAWKKIK